MSSQVNIRARVYPVARAVSAVLASSYAPSLIAQTQTQATGLEEIIVTARKREESLLSIPQEIQAIGEQQIEQANLNTVEDIARFVPSLSYNATTPGRGTIYFRGVADDSSSFIADSSAAIYLDEQPLTQSSLQPEIRLVDIERIEALPGPQGTLYGASSQAGTLRYITNKPDPAAFETSVSLEGSSVEDGEEGYDLSAVLNLPLSENMALRLVGFTAHEAGFIDNVPGDSLGGTFNNADVVDEDINGIDYSGGRAAFRWLPNDEWTVDVGLVYQRTEANSYSEDNVLRSGRELAVVRFADESRDDEWVQTSLTLQGDLGWGQFTSATSYFTRSIEYHQDNTDYTFYLTTCCDPTYYPNYQLGDDPRGLGWSDSPFARRVAQEFRLQGETDRMTWLAGLFYERVHDGFSFFTRVEDYEDTPGFDYWMEDYDVEPGTTDNSFYHTKNDQVTEQYAAFGELGFSLTDRWTFTAGLRWFDHTRTREYFVQQPNGHFTAELSRAEETTSDVTKKLSLQYQVSDTAMVYALYSDGFRAGGRNVTRPNATLPPDYEPDFLDNYELGLKSRWLDGQIAFNLTAFHMEWQDYQVEVEDPNPNFYLIMVTNVGDAEVEGVSTEFSARLWDSLDVGFNAQFLDAKTTSGNPILLTESGARLPFSAEEKGAVWLEYTFPWELAGGRFYGRYQWTYNGDVLNGIDTVDSDPTVQPSYKISDARFGVEADTWEIYAYVDNLGNERAILFDQNSAPPGTITINTPRTWGIGFSKTWGD
jgi:outer membrane receptor protein involved in Fe transport